VKNFNPLHLLALAIVLLAFTYFKLFELKKEINEEKSAFKESKELALKLNEYKKMYADKTHQTQALKRILAQPSLKKEHIEVIKSSKSWKLRAKSISLAPLNSLMNKVLNGTYIIEKLEIKKISNEKAQLYLEIVW
jgi:hypothetical protein